jgi:hypothetical protein
MNQQQENTLVTEHAQLTAKHAGGDSGVVTRLKEIEQELNLSPAEIAQRAIRLYLNDY